MSVALPSVRNTALCLVAFCLAVAGPLLLNQPSPPMIGYPAEIAAVFGWGLVLMLVPTPSARSLLGAAAPLLAVLAIAAVACAASMLTNGLPSSPGIATLGLIALAAVVTVHGASWGASGSSTAFTAFASALLLAGLCGVVMAVVQNFDLEPRVPAFIALSPFVGRASGNIGQPNMFADTLLWALIALVALAQRRAVGGARLRKAQAVIVVVVGLALLFAMVLTGSRTALVATLLLSLWGIVDRGLARSTRILLGTAPLSAALMAGLAELWARSHAGVLWEHSATDITAFRGDIWAQALQLISAQPWLGVGWGQFNFAWTLTPFALRRAGFVNNAHNLPLQLAVEVGLPAALLMMGLLLWAAWASARHIGRSRDATGVRSRAAMMLVLVAGLHSMLEYPLWFAYLLFPVAWAWGFALGAAGGPRAVVEPLTRQSPRTWRVVGLMMVVTGMSAWVDYDNISSLYLAPPDAPAIRERIRIGQESPLFSYIANYVATTHVANAREALPTVEHSSHVLLNGWLMLAWSQGLAAQGDFDRARWLAARLREFNLQETQKFYAPCSDSAVIVKPWQCTPPTASLTWRDFKRP